MKGSLVTTATIVILSLAILVFFKIYSKGLDAPATTVVVGFCIVVVHSVKWLWGRYNKKEDEDVRKT